MTTLSFESIGTEEVHLASVFSKYPGVNWPVVDGYAFLYLCAGCDHPVEDIEHPCVVCGSSFQKRWLLLTPFGVPPVGQLFKSAIDVGSNPVREYSDIAAAEYRSCSSVRPNGVAPPSAPRISPPPKESEFAVSPNLSIAIKQLMLSEQVHEGNHNRPEEEPNTAEEEAEDVRIFSLYNTINEDLIEYLRDAWVDVHLSCIPKKKEKFKAFAREYAIFVPADMGTTAVFVDGVGPRGGVNEQRSLSDYIEFKQPTAEYEKRLFERASDEIKGGLLEKIKPVRGKEEFGRLYDVKLVLSLLATNGDCMRITKYSRAGGRRELIVEQPCS